MIRQFSIIWCFLVMVFFGVSAPLMAAEPAVMVKDVCPEKLICASNPQGVASALQEIGYKAKMEKDSDGVTSISSSASGYNYDIWFMDCEEKANCKSLEFQVTFSKDEGNSAELANEWNRSKRYSAMYYNTKEGTLSINYDVTTVGGINQANFADVVDWWNTMMGKAKVFFDEHPAKGKK